MSEDPQSRFRLFPSCTSKGRLKMLVAMTICFVVGLCALSVFRISGQGNGVLHALNANVSPPALEQVSDIVTLNMDFLVKKSLNLIYHRFMNKIHFQCWSRVRLGKLGDGGWDVCVAGSYKPKFNECLVYSFGINYDWSFDDGALREFGCIVKSFDPTMDRFRHSFERKKGSFFYPIGLWGSNLNKTLPFRDPKRAKKLFPMKTLGTILTQCRDEQKVIDVLKMDIEGSEWQSLDKAMDEGVLQNQVKQLAVEFHSNGF